MSTPCYKIVDCYCGICRSRHRDMVAYDAQPNSSGYFLMTCDQCFERRIGTAAFARYRVYRDEMRRKAAPYKPTEKRRTVR